MIDGGFFVVLSGALTFGAPLALAVRELLVLRPARDGDDGDPRTVPAPLPPCLTQDIPPLVRARPKELEPV